MRNAGCVIVIFLNTAPEGSSVRAMESVQHADGTNVDLRTYLSAQVRLMGKFTTDALKTGPEQNISGDEWKVIDTVRLSGTADPEALKAFGSDPLRTAIFEYWMKHFTCLVGPLARIERMPLEETCARVGDFQSRVTSGLGNMRHYAREHVREIGLMEALQAMQWEHPNFDLKPEGDAASHRVWHMLSSVQFPSIVVNQEGRYFVSAKHPSDPEDFAAPVSAERIDELRKDVAKYAQIR